MLMGVLMTVPRGAPEELNSALGGQWGGVITRWSRFGRPLGG